MWTTAIASDIPQGWQEKPEHIVAFVRRAPGAATIHEQARRLGRA